MKDWLILCIKQVVQPIASAFVGAFPQGISRKEKKFRKKHCFQQPWSGGIFRQCMWLHVPGWIIESTKLGCRSSLHKTDPAPLNAIWRLSAIITDKQRHPSPRTPNGHFDANAYHGSKANQAFHVYRVLWATWVCGGHKASHQHCRHLLPDNTYVYIHIYILYTYVLSNMYIYIVYAHTDPILFVGTSIHITTLPMSSWHSPPQLSPAFGNSHVKSHFPTASSWIQPAKKRIEEQNPTQKCWQITFLSIEGVL